MPRLQSQTLLKSLLSDYYTGLRSPLAWCTSVGPAELLRALGFDVYFPENHGALLGATRTAERYIARAHQAGYGGETCSYLTADIGAWLMRETPLTSAYGLPTIPKPDLIVFNTNQCREVAEWFNFFGREFQCPVVGIYPPRYLEDITGADVDQVVAQFRRLIEVGEEVVGKRLDDAYLSEVVSLSATGSRLWKQVLKTALQAPAPLTFFDGTILMAPIVVLRGTRTCVEFYEKALAELKELTAPAEAAVPDEQVRIFWDGMPVWGRLRHLSETCRNNQASVVASTYCNSWIFDQLDQDDPLESMAHAYTQIFINRGEKTKMMMMKDMIEDYRIDGVVFHDARTCFNNTNSRFGIPQRLQNETGIDTLVIEGDLNDLRFFSDQQTDTKLETFFEQLKMKNTLNPGVEK